MKSKIKKKLVVWIFRAIFIAALLGFTSVFTLLAMEIMKAYPDLGFDILIYSTCTLSITLLIHSIFAFVIQQKRRYFWRVFYALLLFYACWPFALSLMI